MTPDAPFDMDSKYCIGRYLKRLETFVPHMFGSTPELPGQTEHLRDLSPRMLEAVVSVSLPHCWITAVAPRYGAEVRLIDRKLVAQKRMKDLFEAQVPEDLLPEFLQAVRAHPNVRSVEVVSTQAGRLVGIAHTTNCSECAALARSDCFLLRATCRHDSSFEWDLVTRSREAVRTLLYGLDRNGNRVRLERLSGVQQAVTLTPRQEEILRTAFELGYFCYPKKIRLSQLAERLNVSKSTVSEVLRKAQTKVVEGFLQASST